MLTTISFLSFRWWRINWCQNRENTSVISGEILIIQCDYLMYNLFNQRYQFCLPVSPFWPIHFARHSEKINIKSI